MRRLLVLVFALLLPLQFAWGVAAAYCQHEVTTSQGAGHFGHHEHAHKGELKKVAGGKLAVDNDCGVCHGSGTADASVAPLEAVPRPMTQKASGALTLGHASAPGCPPERPQWSRLA